MATLSRLERLQQQVTSLKKPQYDNGEKPYSPAKDNAGNGFAVIRFLWNDEIDTSPFISKFQHGWQEKPPGQEKGRWFIEDCPTTLKEKCPVCEANTLEWNKGLDVYNSVAKKRKRNLNHYCYILVVKDTKNPENEGLVKLFRYGAKLQEKINESISPTQIEGMDETEAFDPYCLDQGRNFNLIFKRKDGNNNVDDSKFSDKTTSILTNKKERDSLFENWKPLSTIIDRSNFKSYDELEKKFNDVVGVTVVKPTPKVERPAPKPVAKVEVEDDLDESSFDSWLD